MPTSQNGRGRSLARGSFPEQKAYFRFLCPPPEEGGGDGALWLPPEEGWGAEGRLGMYLGALEGAER